MSKPKTVVKTINRRIIVDQIASLLYATSIIDDNKEITDIHFGDMSEEQVFMKITYKEVR